MKLKTKIYTNTYREYSISKIEIRLGKNRSLMVDLLRSINSKKFRITPNRIVREIIKNKERLEIIHEHLNSYGCYIVVDPYRVIDYPKEEMNKLYSIVSEKEKETTKKEIKERPVIRMLPRNPSKEKSQMEYMSRFYYGKCKKK